MIDVKIIGLRELIDYIDELDRKTGRRTLQKAAAEGGKFLKPKVQAETPWPSYRRAVRRGTAKRDKPAAIVKYDPKRAPFRHIMLGGSRGHSTKRKRPGKRDIQAFTDGGTLKFSRGHDVAGVTGDPVIKRIADQYGDDALQRVEDYLLREMQLDD